jgi:hypothetical protein
MEHSSENTELEHAKDRNPYNYNELELLKKSNAVKALKEKYPKIPEMWICWMYDVVEHKTEEELLDIVENKKWEKVKPRPQGGTIVGACEIIKNE